MTEVEIQSLYEQLKNLDPKIRRYLLSEIFLEITNPIDQVDGAADNPKLDADGFEARLKKHMPEFQEVQVDRARSGLSERGYELREWFRFFYAMTFLILGLALWGMITAVIPLIDAHLTKIPEILRVILELTFVFLSFVFIFKVVDRILAKRIFEKLTRKLFK